LFEIFGERHAVLRRALEQFDFGSARVIDAALVEYFLSISSLRQRESVHAVAVDPATRTRSDVVTKRCDLQIVIACPCVQSRSAGEIGR
jgi:hypothetical protein